MLKHDHGSRVEIELPTLAELAAIGMADPELLRMEIKRMGLRSVGGVSMASGPPPTQAAPYASPVQHPLTGGVSISGTEFRVDLALKNPTRIITPMVLDLTQQRFFVDRAYTSGGGVTGGAIVYDEMHSADLYADRDVERVTPGTEFPELTFSRRAPRAAEVEKWGGKFYFTDEARDRNEAVLFANAVRQLSNTVVRKINQRGLEILLAAVAANARSVVGNNWSTVVTAGATPSNFTAFPARDFAKADLVSEQEELGIHYGLWILNPNEMFNLEGIYGDKLGALLNSFNVDIFVTQRQPIGTALAISEGQVGEMRIESPYGTETWRDPNGKQQTWVQGSVRPLMLVNNPYAVLEFTGLNG